MSWAFGDGGIPETVVYAWLAFGLHRLLVALSKPLNSAPQAPEHEFPLWAALDM